MSEDAVPERPGVVPTFGRLSYLEDDLGRSHPVVLRVSIILYPIR